MIGLVSRDVTPFVGRRLAAATALVVAGAALSALAPVALKLVIDGLDAPGPAYSGVLPQAMAAYVLALALARIANEARAFVFATARQRLIRSLSERMFVHLMHVPLRFHLERRTGGVNQMLENGVEGVRVMLHHVVFTIVPTLAELLAVLVILAHFVGTRFLLLFFGLIVCYAGAFSCSIARTGRAARRASRERVDAAAAMTDGLLNYETVKYFTAEPLLQERLGDVLRREESEWVGFYRLQSLGGMAVAGVFAGFMAGAVIYATEQVERGGMTIGEFVLVNTYMLQMVRPMEMLGYAVLGVARGAGMLDMVVKLFREPSYVPKGTPVAQVLGAGALEFREVCASYRRGRRVLSQVSFRVAPGSTLGIVGSSGSGKSTLVRLLTRMLEPESGEILMDEKRISDVEPWDVRRWIAVVPQDTVLFDDTLGYNIAFGRPGASRQEIEDAARAAQLHEFVMSLPRGYDTHVGERGAKLSGGERQRISIARAILKAPRIFVFDEATSSLDNRSEAEILRSIRAIAKGRTTLVIAHRLSTVVHADEIVVLEEGRVAEHGTHLSLLGRNGRYAMLWRAQNHGAFVA